MVEEPRENFFEGKKSLFRAIDKIQKALVEMKREFSNGGPTILIPYICTSNRDAQEKQAGFIRDNLDFIGGVVVYSFDHQKEKFQEV